MSPRISRYQIASFARARKPGLVVVAGSAAEQVGHKPGPAGPGRRILWVTGIVGDQHRLGAGAGGGCLSGSEAVTQDGLGEPVQLQPVLVDAGQGPGGQLG